MRKILFLSFFLLVSVFGFAQDNMQNQPKEEDAAVTKNAENKPLYVVVLNGKKFKMSENSIREIKSEWIDSMNVLKNEEMTKRYGQLGKNGVVEIFVKNEASKKLSKEFLQELY